METREELEAALAASWDRDTLTVYADHLQAEGDPRGELIALDLEIEAKGSSVELSKRRTSLLYAWLGRLVPVDNVHASWVGDSLRFGFVDDLHFEGGDPNALARFEQVLDSPAGPYVRGLTMTGHAQDLERALSALASREHAWLSRMSIGLWSAQPTIGEPAWRAAFAAMPHLESLELRPNAAFAPFSHPTITKLAIRGDAVYAALGDGASFDRVTELDLDLTTTIYPPYYDDEYIEAEEPAGVELPTIAFPALRKLDLAQNGVARIDAAYQFLRTFAARSHITHVRIPQLRSAADRNELVNAIHDMPKLEVVEVVQGHYYEPPDLPTGNVRFVRAETWPWPTQELARGKGLRVYQPGAKYGDTITLFDAVYLMERSFEQLPRPARAAWSQLWHAVAALGKEPASFPARVLADAVEACPELMQNGWRELREELAARRPLAADAMVRIERCKA